MCSTCGCNLTPGNRHLLEPPVKATRPGTSPESVLGGLLAANNRQAEANRARLDAHGILTINLMSSPGSGKTALLEATIRSMREELRIAVIEGDLETENDADRIRALGVSAHQITTGTACHLDAHLVAQGLDNLDLDAIDVLFVENVGNLVCPASFDLGHHRNVTLLSVTEGDDKPAKYPVMFRASDLMLITKVDLLVHLPEFSTNRAETFLRRLASDAPVLTLSARNGDGVAQWQDWLRRELDGYRALTHQKRTLTPRIQPDGARPHRAENPQVRFVPVPGASDARIQRR
ncbi:MAG: hydrogenase nickel incorporation protein HypB [Gammaproteobacteria bacterium]|nr:hydrogenase nickel incorporation protein HypB [Gammaproteobacteria bacterium]